MLSALEYAAHIAVIAGIYAILAQSLNLIVGYAGQAALGHAGFSCVGAYASALLALKVDLPVLLSIPLAACVGALTGAVISYPSIRLKGDYLALATFGAGVIIYSLAMNLSDFTGGAAGIGKIPPPKILGLAFTTPESYLCLVFVATLVTVVVMYRIAHSPFGRVLRAIRDDEIAVLSLGRNVGRYKLAAFAVGGGLAGLAGALNAHYVTFIDPTSFTTMESITILLMVVLGGMGTVKGPIIGATILVLFPEFLRVLVIPTAEAAAFRQVVYGTLLVSLMMFRPQGLFGKYGLR